MSWQVISDSKVQTLKRNADLPSSSLGPQQVATQNDTQNKSILQIIQGIFSSEQPSETAEMEREREAIKEFEIK